MGNTVDFRFFCSALDYPKFRALLQVHFPPTYDELVARKDQGIKDAMEIVIVKKSHARILWVVRLNFLSYILSAKVQMLALTDKETLVREN